MALTLIGVSGVAGLNIDTRVQSQIGIEGTICLYELSLGSESSLGNTLKNYYTFTYNQDTNNVDAQLTASVSFLDTISGLLKVARKTENNDNRETLFRDIFNYRFQGLNADALADSTTRDAIKGEMITNVCQVDLLEIFSDSVNVNNLFDVSGSVQDISGPISSNDVVVVNNGPTSWITVPLNVESADGYKSLHLDGEGNICGVGNQDRFYHFRIHWV